MTKLPLVSVIVPAFNAESTIAETLESAAAQSWKNIEIIVVDDGSTDATADIAAAFCARDSRARLLRQANAGVAAARNRAIAEARGQWIAPLDADDLWHPLKIEWQVAAAADRSGVGLIYSWTRKIDTAGRVIGSAPLAQADGDVLEAHLRSNFVGNGSTALISRRALGLLRYDSRVDACADYLLQLRLAAVAPFAHVPAYLTAYRVADGNMSANAIRMIREHVLLFEILMLDLPQGHRSTAAQQLAMWKARLALVLLKRGNVSEGSTAMCSALAGVPNAALREVVDRVRDSLQGRGLAPVHPGRPFVELGPQEHLA